ncbi:MAG: secreted protein containing, partial [Polaromonas sp.]|nr:secreted protein containing [Polaromonas sp.]
MMRMNQKYKPAQALFTQKALVAAIAVVCSSSVMAIELNTGNDDVKLRWDNTVRYNLGTRMESPDSRILASPSYDE